MSQIGKLYKFYFKKIWQKNWLRIIIFTILIGVVWWFVIPWAGTKVLKAAISGQATNLTEEQRKEQERLNSFSEIARTFGLGGQAKAKFKNKAGEEVKITGVKWDLKRKEFRELLEDETKWEQFLKRENIAKDTQQERFTKWYLRMIDSGNYFGLISFPFNSDNSFFCSQTQGYNNIKEKSFWKLLFDISWWNLAGVVVLYWFIFEVFDKTFFSPRKDGEEAMVSTMTPGVQRSDLIWGRILAFLTFYFLINIVLFLIPFGIYYFWLASEISFPWFALLALITVIVGPLLFFGLIFAPYLFLGSLIGGSKWIFSTLVTFSPMLWGGIKLISSASWPYTMEKTFFDPVWFTIISLVVGIFFLTLYYLRYQEEDLH